MKLPTVLVTGGTGFIGAHTLRQLLQQGFTVKTTLRSRNRQHEITEALGGTGIDDLSRLSFYEADLRSDTGWDEAVSGCDYVLHIASPFETAEPRDAQELIVPAREGTLRVLGAAVKAGVKRVVLTSSFAAIGYSIDPKEHVFTEADWTDPEAALPAYILSKTLAEKAAWDFIAQQGGSTELAVINPVGVFGPLPGQISSASVDMVIKNIINGSTRENAPFTFGVVDVRDVADIHLKAMLHPQAGGQRFLATAPGAMSFYDVAALIRRERPAIAASIADMRPTPPGDYIRFSNAKAVQVLGWHPRSREEALLASVDSYAREIGYI